MEGRFNSSVHKSHKNAHARSVLRHTSLDEITCSRILNVVPNKRKEYKYTLERSPNKKYVFYFLHIFQR